jgi:transglutaminase-like putative cysteine protease
MHYSISHLTRFTYASPISESLMELRMRPSSDRLQRCLQFELDVQPRARVFAYTDFLGNWIHHFDIPRRHAELAITARARVEIEESPSLPDALDMAAWRAIEEWETNGDFWDFRQPSRFAVWSDPLIAFTQSLGPVSQRRLDPLTTVRDTMAAIHRSFEYAPNSTRVDSPIDEALAAGRGVCQDFAHIMLAALRHVGVPCRYVSGYIAPRVVADGAEPTTIATHAWIEVRLPELGWVGVDPTHNTTAGARHVRVAVGRDYADVPPTRGVFKGTTASTLSVAVEVTRAETLPTLDPAVVAATWTADAPEPAVDEEREKQLLQQQQQ